MLFLDINTHTDFFLKYINRRKIYLLNLYNKITFTESKMNIIIQIISF